ncbi:MAG: IS6 family transposase, partial [Candidatus Paceibacteria bacterium]
MILTDLLKERSDVENQDTWENERTPTPVRYFAIRLHLMRLSLREIEAVLDWLGVDRCHQAIWYWK